MFFIVYYNMLHMNIIIWINIKYEIYNVDLTRTYYIGV